MHRQLQLPWRFQTSRHFMTFEEFEHLARLHVIGALEPDEIREFETARAFFGKRAEEYLNECRRLHTALALRLKPMPPNPATREKLLRHVRHSQHAH